MSDDQQKPIPGEPKPFSFQSEEDFKQTINKMMHGAMTQRFTSFEQKLEKLLSTAAPKTEQQEDPERITLTQRLTKMEKELTAAKEETARERAAGRDQKLRQELQQAMTKKGLSAAQARALTSQLIHEDKAVKIDESGQISFKGDYESEELDLTTGLDRFFKTDAGKEFIPARNPRGTGERPFQRGQVSNVPSQEQQDAELLEGLAGLFDSGAR